MEMKNNDKRSFKTNIQNEHFCKTFRGNFWEKYNGCFVNETSLGAVVPDLVLGGTGD